MTDFPWWVWSIAWIVGGLAVVVFAAGVGKGGKAVPEDRDGELGVDSAHAVPPDIIVKLDADIVERHRKDRE